MYSDTWTDGAIGKYYLCLMFISKWQFVVIILFMIYFISTINVYELPVL